MSKFYWENDSFFMRYFFLSTLRNFKFSPWMFLLFFVLVFSLSLRGLPGNLMVEEMMATDTWRTKGPLELSPERGRFALLYSVVEDHSLFFSPSVAQFAMPDVAIDSKGRFVSLFAPFLSFILIPGYLLGKALGASQVGASAMIALFAVLNGALIRAIAMRLGAGRMAASLGALAFLFGTPAFAYGTTLYQHHVTVFLLLLSIVTLLRWEGFWSLAFVALLTGISAPLDNPNAFLFVPIVIWAVTRVVRITMDERITFSIRPLFILTGFAATIPFALFLWYNSVANGGPFQLSGTLQSAPATQQVFENFGASNEKTAIGFFKTRSLLNGLYIHLTSPDRGVVRYAPVILFGIAGFIVLYRKRRLAITNVLVGVSMTTLLLYSLWGDPWGGWAFGSRYLIPAYAMLGIGLGVALEARKQSFLFLGIFFAALLYSIGVNTLGAVTSSANPPQVEVLQLEAISKKVQRYSFDRNWQYLQENGSKSFVYQTWANRYMDAEKYYWLLVSMVVLGSSMPMILLIREGILEKHRV